MAGVFGAPLIIKRGKHYAAHILKTPGLSNGVKSDYTRGGRGSVYSALIGLNDEVMPPRDRRKGDEGLLALPATNQGAGIKEEEEAFTSFHFQFHRLQYATECVHQEQRLFLKLVTSLAFLPQLGVEHATAPPLCKQIGSVLRVSWTSLSYCWPSQRTL